MTEIAEINGAEVVMGTPEEAYWQNIVERAKDEILASTRKILIDTAIREFAEKTLTDEKNKAEKPQGDSD